MPVKLVLWLAPVPIEVSAGPTKSDGKTTPFRAKYVVVARVGGALNVLPVANKSLFALNQPMVELPLAVSTIESDEQPLPLLNAVGAEGIVMVIKLAFIAVSVPKVLETIKVTVYVPGKL